MHFVSGLWKSLERLTGRRAWIAEGICAAVFGLAVTFFAVSFGLLVGLERASLDWRFRLFPRPDTASRDITLVLIDQNSILHFEKQLGRWPWKRAAYPPMLDIFRRGGARLVVFDLLFSEGADKDDDLAFGEALAKSRNAILSFQVAHPRDEQQIGGKQELLPRGVPTASLNGLFLRKWGPGVPPIEELRKSALGMGFVNLFADEDGPTRRMPLLLRRGDGTHDSLALAVARFHLGENGRPAPVHSVPGETLLVGKRKVPVTPEGDLLLRYHGSLEESFLSRYPAGAVLQAWIDLKAGKKPKLDPEVFRDKVVIIGATAAGTFDLRATPFSPSDPGVFHHATAISNLLEGYFLRTSGRMTNSFAQIFLVMFSAFFMAAPLSLFRRGTILAAGISLFLTTAVFLTIWVGVWLELVAPVLGFTVAAVTGLGLNYLREGRQRALVKRIFMHYMNPEVVNMLVSDPNRIRLGGERRDLSIFFSDLENFTNLSERLEPEQLVSLLNIYLTEMTDIILKYDGFLDKYEGDAIMAAFGTPISYADHARRACWAALENVERLNRLMGELRDGSYFATKGIPPLDMPPDYQWDLAVRIGVNSGAVVAGNMGSLARMDYTVMGDAVNLASRLEGANKTYGTRVIAGEETVRLAGDTIETRVLDLLRVKGKDRPVWVYEVMARGGELPADRALLRTHFEKGHTAYMERHWEDATDRFRTAIEADPTDTPSQIYLERCAQYRRDPPPETWQGVFTMTSK